jgi:hypothetical protein
MMSLPFRFQVRQSRFELIDLLFKRLNAFAESHKLALADVRYIRRRKAGGNAEAGWPSLSATPTSGTTTTSHTSHAAAATTPSATASASHAAAAATAATAHSFAHCIDPFGKTGTGYWFL